MNGTVLHPSKMVQNRPQTLSDGIEAIDERADVMAWLAMTQGWLSLRDVSSFLSNMYGIAPGQLGVWDEGEAREPLVKLEMPTAIPLARCFTLDLDLTPVDQLEQAGLGLWQRALPVKSLAGVLVRGRYFIKSILRRGVPVREHTPVGYRQPAVEAAPVTASTSSDALKAADELRQWLNLTYEDLEKITGIAKETFHYWRRTAATPRPSTVRRLWRVHALVRALRSRLGEERAREWLYSGHPNPIELLLQGNLEAVEVLAQKVLFSPPTARPEEQPDYAPFLPEPEFDLRVETAGAPLRRARRRPTRGRLPGS